jgi:hypothetical protein
MEAGNKAEDEGGVKHFLLSVVGCRLSVVGFLLSVFGFLLSVF